MTEITKYFFEKNCDALNQLNHYAPNDAQLLDIPYYMMAQDPFLLTFNSPPIQDARKGALLFSYLRSINTTLAITIAAYSFIIGNYNKQPSNDYEVIIHSEILRLYQSSLRDFIANLKVVVDQMLIVLAKTHIDKYDCIGGFLKQLHKYEKLQCLEYFFLKLNTAANYLKHHVDQLESFQEIHFIGLKLRVMAAKKEDYKNLCKYLTITEIIEKTEKEVVYYLDLAALIAEFNKFKALFLEELAAPKRHHV